VAGVRSSPPGSALRRSSAHVENPAPLLTLALLAVGSARPVEARQGSCEPAWLPAFGGEPGVGDRVQALAVFDDGRGKALYAGGSFTTAGGAAASHVACWDGTSWSALGLGVDAAVQAPAVFDDGSGARLGAGGAFTSAGGAAANRIACWDGTSWTPLGSGMNDAVRSLAVCDVGGGPELYAAGAFTVAGGGGASRAGTARAGRRSAAA